MNFLRNIISTLHKPNILKNLRKPKKNNPGTITIPDDIVSNTNLHVNDDNINNIDKNVQNVITDENIRNMEINAVNINNLTDKLDAVEMTGENDSFKNKLVINEITTEIPIKDITILQISENNDSAVPKTNKNTNNYEVKPSEKEVFNLDDSLDIESKLNTTVIIKDVVITNNIDEIATTYLSEFNVVNFDDRLIKETKLNKTNEIINDGTKQQDSYDKTKELQEFDNILENVIKNSELTVKNVTLDEIQDVIELDDAHNFQEIQYVNSNHSIVLEDYNEDVISISSNDDDDNIQKTDENLKITYTISLDSSNKKSQDMDNISINSDSNDGYHSSDFEFITEEEAKMDGFIINFNAERNLNTNSVEEHIENNDAQDMDSVEHENDEVIADNRSMENYAVPEGDDYMKLFEGQNAALAISEIRYSENKCLIPRAPMYVQYQGIGFDMNLAPPQYSDDDEYQQEAHETLNKIAEIYPQNRRSKRRRRF